MELGSRVVHRGPGEAVDNDVWRCKGPGICGGTTWSSRSCFVRGLSNVPCYVVQVE